MSTRCQAIERAKRHVINSGRVGIMVHVCLEDGECGPEYVVLSDAWYQETGEEEKCVASVWSYEDGRYDEANVFRPNGRIAAAVEEHD